MAELSCTRTHSAPEQSTEPIATLQFLSLTPPLPPQTQVTSSIEDIIKTRIKESLFDDVVRTAALEKAKYKPKPAELSEEKSGLGLGDAYAKEYEELIMGHTSAERSKIEQAQHEVKELFSKLGQRLDGLFNFHAVPKPFKSEVSVKSNVSAIRMEEAMPTAMAESMSLAPEEVYGKKKGNALTTRTELSQAERKAERRKKKRVKKRVTGEKDHVEEVRARINPEGTSAKRIQAKKDEKALADAKRKGMVVDGPHAKKAQRAAERGSLRVRRNSSATLRRSRSRRRWRMRRRLALEVAVERSARHRTGCMRTRRAKRTSCRAVIHLCEENQLKRQRTHPSLPHTHYNNLLNQSSSRTILL